MRVVVTGARGHVGGAVVDAALAAGHEVVALTRNPSGAPAGPTWVAWDVQAPDPAVLAGAVVVHAAAHVPERMDDPDQAEACLQVNALGTLTLLRACAEAGVQRFVLASGNLYAPLDRPATEDDPLISEVRAPYYLGSKWLADLWARRWAAELPVTVLRIGSVYGGRMRWRGLIPTFLDRLSAGQGISVHDGGRYQVDLVHVDDVAAACLAAGTSAPGVYNIGSGTATTTRDVALAAAEVTGADASLVEIQPPRDGPPDRGFPPLDVSRARETLGYGPCTLPEGLRRTLAARG